MNHLKSITFINTATLPYAEVLLDGNTLLSGKNGTGKTTILRAVLFFYGAQRGEQLGITRGKKRPFDEYYFGNSNSYLIYRYQNEHGAAMVIAYKTGGGRVKFRFALEAEESDSDVRALFFDGTVACEPSELFKRMREAGYDLLSQAVTAAGNYRRILYGQDRAQSKYTFFQANSEFDQIAKTLSNVFINSKLDSGSIKKSLVSSINGFSFIDLEQKRKRIDEFRTMHQDIVRFEQNTPILNNALDALHLYDEQRLLLQATAAQLSVNVAFAETRSEELKLHETELVSEIGKIQVTFNEVERSYKANEKECGDEIAVLKDKITETKEKLREYRSKKIEEKLQQWEKKPMLESELAKLQQQYAELTASQKALSDRFTSMRRNEQESFHQNKYTFEQGINALNAAFNTKVTALNSDRETALQENQQQHLQKKNTLLGAVDTARESLHKTQKEAIRIEAKRFLESEIIQAEEIHRKAQEALLGADTANRDASQKIKTHTAQIASIEQGKEHSIKRLSLTLENKRNTFVKEIEQQKKRLHLQEGSFLNFLREHQHEHEGTIAALLKDEVLFSETLEPRILEVDSTTLYGVGIKTTQLDASCYAADVIQAKIKEAEQAVKALQIQVEDEKSEIENKIRNTLNAELRERKRLEELSGEHERNRPKLELEQHRALEKLNTLQHDAQVQKQHAVDEQNKAVISCQANLDAATKEQQDFSVKVETEIAAIKEHHEKSQSELEAQTKKSIDAKNQMLNETKEQYETSIKEIGKQERNTLENEGVDGVLLEQFSSDIDKTKKELGVIASYEILVREYHIDQKRLFEPLGANEEKLSALQRAYSEIDEAFSKEVQLFNDQKSVFEKRKQVLNEELRTIKNDLENYETFKKSSFFDDVGKFEPHNELQPNDDGLQPLIDRLKDLVNERNRSKEQLRKKAVTFFNKFSQNNIFTLAIPNSENEQSLIASARALKRFVEEDKIDTFKEGVAKQFGMVLRNLSTETKELLDAENEISKTISKINKTLNDLQGIKVIEKVELRFQPSNNQVLNTLKQMMELNDSRPYGNEENLFTLNDRSDSYNKQLLKLLDELATYLEDDPKNELRLEDTFVLEFRAIENGNDSGFVASLDGVGSNGTDVMVKSMVNIAMLSQVRKASGKVKEGVYFHCIMDEIGILHPDYLKELIEYANNKQIRFLNGAPDEKLVTTYKRLYMLSTNPQHQTVLRRLVSKV